MISTLKIVLTSAPLLFNGVTVDDVVDFSKEYTLTQIEKKFDSKLRDVEKVTEALFFETRGTCDKDKFAVAEVILQRTALDNYPSDVLKVINQYTWKNGKKVCQFSYMCEGNIKNKRKLIREDYAEWRKSKRVAFVSIMFGPTDYTKGADHYFNPRKVTPSWYNPRKVTTTTCAHRYLKLHKS